VLSKAKYENWLFAIIEIENANAKMMNFFMIFFF
jgi:hypothetical protein